MSKEIVAVCSRTFIENETLREELLEKYPNARLYSGKERLSGAFLASFLLGAEKAIIGLEKIDAIILRHLPPDLKLISKFGVGLDNIDIGALRSFRVKLKHTPGVNANAVAEMTLTFMLCGCRFKNEELRGKTIGIIGHGHIGSALGGMIIYLNTENGYLYNDIRKDLICSVPKKHIYEVCDIITIHTPLDDSTRNMITSKELEMMKRDAILINTARAGIVNEDDLMYHMSTHRDFLAYFDTYDHPLIDTLVNFHGTNHIAGTTKEAVLAMGRAAIANLED